jgi:hypothetical protein
VLLLWIAILAVLVLVPVVLLSQRGRGSDLGRVLAMLALLSAVVITAASLPLLLDATWPIDVPKDERPGEVVRIAVPPVVITLLAAAAAWLPRGARIGVTWFTVVLMLAYVVVFGPGLGYAYLPTAALLVAAAALIHARSAPPSVGQAAQT